MALVQAAYEYSPQDSTGTFKDDLNGLSSTMFKTSGVKCRCGSKRTFYNKYSFKAQHFESSMHKKYLDSLNKERPDILKEHGEMKKELREIRCLETKSRNKEAQLRRELHEKNDTIEKQRDIIEEKCNDIEQMKEYLKDATKLLTDTRNMEQKNKDLTQTIKDYENMALGILKKQGYEVGV
jgi:chromosome segregation ATPase